MADDHADMLHDALQQARLARSFAWIALWLVGLLVFTLIERGVLASWSDLFHPVAGPAGG